MHGITLLALCLVASCAIFNGVNGNRQLSQDLYQEIHSTPILMYECFRTGVTNGPWDTVNHAILYDRTQPYSYHGEGQSWFSRSSNPGRVYKTRMLSHYDPQLGVGITHFPGLSLYADLVAKTPTDSAYFYRLLIPSQGRVVYKVFDVNRNCLNAQALLNWVCPGGCNMEYSRVPTYQSYGDGRKY